MEEWIDVYIIIWMWLAYEEWNDPDGGDSLLGAANGRAEFERMANGVPAIDRDECEGQNRHGNGYSLRGKQKYRPISIMYDSSSSDKLESSSQVSRRGSLYSESKSTEHQHVHPSFNSGYTT